MALSRKDKIIAVIFSIVLFGTIVGYVYVYPIIKYGGPSWPNIDNPSELLKECKGLLSDYPKIIEDVNWPDSIRNLSPKSVIGKKDFVDIRLAGGGIASGWGYIVFPDYKTGIPAPADYIVRGTVFPGIFRYIDKQH